MQGWSREGRGVRAELRGVVVMGVADGKRKEGEGRVNSEDGEDIL